jgi:hypothetical protein
LEDASASAVFSQLVNPQGRWWWDSNLHLDVLST